MSRRKTSYSPSGNGIFPGFKESSNEFFIGTDSGVFKASQIKRVPESERFEVERLKSLAGVPWSMTPEDDSDLTTALPAIVVIPASTDESVPNTVIPESVPRQISITNMS